MGTVRLQSHLISTLNGIVRLQSHLIMMIHKIIERESVSYEAFGIYRIF